MKKNTKLDRRLLGMSALNQFSVHNSASRSVMFLQHISQCLSLINPDNRILISGLEAEVDKASFSKYIPADSKVLEIIEYYGPYDNAMEYPIKTDVLYYNSNKKVVDLVSVELWDKYDRKYGFEHKFTEDMENLYVGESIDVDTKLTKTNSSVNDLYSFGKNIPLMSITSHNVAEDAVIISESTAKDLSYYTYETTRFSIGGNSVPMNTHGDIDNYKIIPDVGDSVGDKGILLATREMSVELFGILFSKSDMMNPDPTFDRVYDVTHQKGTVVDIDVIYTPKNSKYSIYEDTFSQVDDYAKAQSSHRERLIERGNHWIEQYNTIAGDSLHPIMINAMRIESDLTTNLYKRDEMQEYTVDITVRYENIPTVKHKITTMHGMKGIIVEVRPDNEMPIDNNGIRAGVIMNPNSTIHRMNLGGKYEGEFTTAAYLVSQHVKNTISAVGKPSDKLIMELHEYVVGFIKLFGNEQYDIFKNLKLKDVKSLIMSIIRHGISVYLPIDNPKRNIDIAKDLFSSNYCPKETGFEIYSSGKMVPSHRKGMCDFMYVFLLNKTGDIGLSVASSKLNHFGLLSAPNTHIKNASVYNGSPTKILSETETRLLLSTAGQEALAELRNRSLSHDSHRIVYENILNADLPTNIEDVIDRSINPIVSDVPLDILKSIFNTMGLKFTTEK